MFSRTELLQEAQWRRCKKDFEYFCAEFWKVQTPDGAQPYRLFDAQRIGFETFEADRYVITLKARQIGWTTLVAAYTFWKASFNEDWACVFLSATERDAVQILNKVVYGFKRLPEWMLKRGPRRTNDNRQEFFLANGSEIVSLPSKENPARGRTVNLVIVDEWAFLENPDEAWASIEPITDVGGRCIGLSTANGWGNFFHQMWVGASTGSGTGSLFTPLFFPWDARPDRNANWYEQKRETLPEWQLHQEYPANEHEAFLKSGNPVFDVDALSKIQPRNAVTRGYLVRHAKQWVEFREGRHGELSILSRPNPGHAYVVGSDVAEGLEHGDYSAAYVIDLNEGEIAAIWHGHTDPDLFGEVLYDLGVYYGVPLIGCEYNNHGISTNLRLRDLGYPNIYFAWTYDERGRKQNKKIGWHTNRATRPLMIDELAMDLRNGSLGGLDKHTIGELMTFVRDDKGRMAGSPFDDRVIALAIANQMRKHARAAEFKQSTNDYWTVDWFWKQIEKQDSTEFVIGAHNARS